MKRLSKERLAEREAHAQALSAATEEYNQAVRDFNDAVAAQWTTVEACQGALVDRAEEAKAWADEVAAEITEYVDERSEKWQESDAGEAARSWATSWEDVDLDFDHATAPEELEEIAEEDLRGRLEELPEEPEG